jgi:protein ImuB
MSRRTCCLAIPLFPLAARLRSEPDLRSEALAIFEGNGARAALVAATRRARAAGLEIGMTLSQARALVPRLVVRGRDVECERAARETLVEIASACSPRVEDAGEGVVYLDISGTERHFEASDPETDLARSLLLAIEGSGLVAWAGIASSKLAARIAADKPPTPRVVPPGREAAFLAPLPLHRLCPESAVHETLRRWGLRTIGELAALPANQIESRLGACGKKLHEQARGLDASPLVPAPAPPSFHEGMELDWPLTSIEPFLFVASTALDRLCHRLEGRGLACARLGLSLRLDPTGFDERSILLPAPTTDAKTLLTLTRLDLERSIPGSPVVGFTFTAHPDRPHEAQLTLFGPTALSPTKLATTLARLFALLGKEGAGSPRAVDSHLPERSRLEDFAPLPPPEHRSEPTRGRGLLAVRLLQPPIALEVDTAVGEPGAGAHPLRVSIRTVDTERPQPKISGAVRVASGPWSVEEEWWTERPTDREYWDVELASGGLYRLFRERRTGAWYADGIYD